MPTYICDDEIDSYIFDACEVDTIAAISAVGISRIALSDWSSTIEWEAAIANGNATVIKKISADIPDAAPLLIDNKRSCGPAQKLIGNDMSNTIVDPNISESHNTFWENTNGKTVYVAYYLCKENKIIVYSNGTIQARPFQAVGGETDTAHYNVTIQHRLAKNDFGIYVDAPSTSVFE